MLETNFFGSLRVSQAFAPALKDNGGGALQLARALGDNAEGRAVLSAARKALLRQHDTAPPATI